ncbi:MAG TPA: dienelactone hydrolase family protein [Candidatus Acidoferrum sp.]|nr:dienelactone hydrolase family protein [Candidatus Acidoferrum sp.]
MCVSNDSHPPIPAVEGGAIDSSEVILRSDDGTEFKGFAANAAEPSGAGVVVLPDVRGLHPFYHELAMRFAEAGHDAIAMDPYGRTAGTAPRGADFDHMTHAPQATYDGLLADLRASAAELGRRAAGHDRAVFTIGFCAGGRLAFDSAAAGLGLAGVIGFYGFPVGPTRTDVPAPVDLVGQMACPVLGLFGGADRAIAPSVVEEFESALSRAGVRHRVVSYPDAPHSFFDKASTEHAAAAIDAWQQVLGFIAENTPPA